MNILHAHNDNVNYYLEMVCITLLLTDAAMSNGVFRSLQLGQQDTSCLFALGHCKEETFAAATVSVVMHSSSQTSVFDRVDPLIGSETTLMLRGDAIKKIVMLCCA